MWKLLFSWPIWPFQPQNWPTINQFYDIVVTSYIKYLWLRYTMRAIESVQITPQLLKYAMYAGATSPNDSCFMTLVARALKYFIDVILLQIHCSHGLNLGVKIKVSSCKFWAALVSVLISINSILFDGGHIGYWGVLLTSNLVLANSIVFACFKNIYLDINILHL